MDEVEETAGGTSYQELKFVALLVVAVALLKLAAVRGSLILTTVRELDNSANAFGFVLLAGTVGSLAVFWVAPRIDRYGPHPVMALGAVIAAIGTLTLIVPLGLPGSAVSLFIAGAGGSALSPPMVYAVIAKRTLRWRGAAIGAVAAVFGLRQAGLPDVYEAIGHEWSVVLAVVLLLACAALLYRYMPELFAREAPEHLPSLKEIGAAPGFAKTFASVAAVFAIGSLVTGLSAFYPYWIERAGSGVSLSGPLSAVPAASALLWGVACMNVPLRRLLAIAGLFIVVAALLMGISVASFIFLGIAKGALLTLPWVFAAERLGVQRLATLGIGLAFAGAIFGIPGPLLVGWLIEQEMGRALQFAIAGLGGALAAAAYWVTPPANQSLDESARP